MQLSRKRGHAIITVKPPIWWGVESDGMVFTQIRCNKITLNLDGQGPAIRVGKLRRLPSVYRIVIKAVKAGELDLALKNASRDSRP